VLPFKYLPFWEPGSAITLPNWLDLPDTTRACEALVLSPTSVNLTPGATARIRYSLSGDEWLSLNISTLADDGFTAVTNAYSTNVLGAITGGDPPFMDRIAPGTGNIVFVVPAIISSVNVQDLLVTCTDGSGSGFVVPGSANLGITATLTPSDTSCWAYSGMSFTSPALWITGIAKMLSCVARDLFVPGGGAVLDQFDEVNATFEDKPPFIVIFAVVDFAGDVKAEFDTRSGDGCFSVDIPVAGVDPGATCFGDGVNVEPAQRSTMSLFIIGPMLLGLIGHAIGLVRER